MHKAERHIDWVRSEPFRYFAIAIVLMACLMVVSKLAPNLPIWAIIPILIAYALLSTIGALYHTVIWRLHKQYKLNATGKLSHYNRRWRFWLLGFMVAGLVSAFLFVLQSPKWDWVEWLLMWIAIPVYYCVYKGAERFLKKEYAPRFYKSRAMILSFWVVGMLLCVAYALVAAWLPGPDYNSIEAAFDGTVKHYANSPSALMSDLDKLTSFADGLTSYGMFEIAKSSYIVGFACRFVVYAAVIFSMVNQFGFCLLTPAEIKSEFQLLPVCDEDAGKFDVEGGIDWWYVGIAALVSVAAAVVLAFGEARAGEAMESEEQTAIEAFIDDQTRAAIHVVDGGMERAINREELEAEMRDELTPLVESYFDDCKGNVESYVNWRKSPLGMLSNWAQRGEAVKKFEEKITAGVSDEDIESIYNAYQSQMLGLDTDAEGQSGIVRQLYSLNLWAVLKDPQYADQVNGLFANEDDLESKVNAIIDLAQNEVLSNLSVSL